MDFMTPGGLSRAFERTATLEPPPITEEEWAERKRLFEQRHELRKPVALELFIDGRAYTTRSDGSMLIELPAVRANELLNREIDLGGGCSLRITFQTVS